MTVISCVSVLQSSTTTLTNITKGITTEDAKSTRFVNNSPAQSESTNIWPWVFFALSFVFVAACTSGYIVLIVFRAKSKMAHFYLF